MVEIAFENGRISDLKGSWPWHWIGLYCILSCINHRPLHTCQISLKSKKLSVDRQTYRRIHGRTFETGLIRQTLSKSWPKNINPNHWPSLIPSWGRKLSKHTNKLYSAEINTWIMAHYRPGAHTGRPTDIQIDPCYSICSNRLLLRWGLKRQVKTKSECMCYILITTCYCHFWNLVEISACHRK